MYKVFKNIDYKKKEKQKKNLLFMKKKSNTKLLTFVCDFCIYIFFIFLFFMPNSLSIIIESLRD